MANIPPSDPPGGKPPAPDADALWMQLHPPPPKISGAPRPPAPLSRPSAGVFRPPRFESPSIEFDYGPSFPPDGCAKVKLAILAAVGMDPTAGIVHALRAYIGVARTLGKSGVWLFPECNGEIERFLQFLASSQRSTTYVEAKTALEGMPEYKKLLRWFARKDKRPQATPVTSPDAVIAAPEPPPAESIHEEAITGQPNLTTPKPPVPSGPERSTEVDGQKLKTLRDTTSQEALAEACKEAGSSVSVITIRRGEAGERWFQSTFNAVAKGLSAILGRTITPEELKAKPKPPQ